MLNAVVMALYGFHAIFSTLAKAAGIEKGKEEAWIAGAAIALNGFMEKM